MSTGSTTLVLVFIFCTCNIWDPISGSRILISAPYGTKSYQNMIVPLAQRLVKRNHEVTVITNYHSKDLDAVPGLNQIVLEKLKIHLSEYPNQFETAVSAQKQIVSGLIGFKNLFLLPLRIAEEFYSNSHIYDLIKGTEDSEPFDVIIATQTFNGASYPLSWYFKAPLVIFTPNAPFPGLVPSLGDSDHPEYLPIFLSSLSDHMNLFQRTTNAISVFLYDIFIHRWHWNTIRSIAENYVGKDLPPIGEIEQNVSLILTNTHPSFTYPRVLLPQVVEVGGLHCRQPKQLPSELEEFVQSSQGEGFIVFAVGSVYEMSEMPERMIRIFTEVFSRLKQKIVWQWKGEIKYELPANVLAIPWLPQQDLLGHELCRLIIAHGGLSSLQEAIYHGVPVLGMPFGTDQKLNIKRAVKDGYALQLDWSDLNEEALYEALQMLLNNQSFSLKAEYRSLLFRDQMQSPIERAVFSIEQVIRNGGSEHLRLGSVDLAWYQRNLIDVFIVILLWLSLSAYFFVFCLKKFVLKNKDKVRPESQKSKAQSNRKQKKQ